MGFIDAECSDCKLLPAIFYFVHRRSKSDVPWISELCFAKDAMVQSSVVPTTAFA